MKLGDSLYSYYHYKLYELLADKGKVKESSKKNYFSNETNIFKKKEIFRIIFN